MNKELVVNFLENEVLPAHPGDWDFIMGCLYHMQGLRPAHIFRMIADRDIVLTSTLQDFLAHYISYCIGLH